ncbi:TIGR04222 domain-containing membrane protein [Pseudonocardia sp.]|uniref:TIGR04222 domain-containing membrane protein n=1 Tax=Pseudonocardia sp. TaxID=60912 RepID=UPI003D0F7C90
MGVAEWLVMAPHLLLAAGGAAVTAWAWAVSLRPPGRAHPGAQPDVDELAYLAGGPRRVVEVAVARLVRSGALEVRARARVRPRDPGGAAARPIRGGAPADPARGAGAPPDVPVLDRRVLHDAGRDGAIGRILAAHAGDPEVDAARDRLAAAGLVGDPAAAGNRRRARRTLVTLTEVSAAAGALMFAGLVIGIARTGTSPVWFGVLGVAVTVTAGLGVLAWAVDPHPPPRFRTVAGLRALAAARRASTSRAQDRRVALAGLGAEVPLGWRAGWWRARHLLRRLVPVAAVAMVIAVTAEVLLLVARLS